MNFCSRCALRRAKYAASTIAHTIRGVNCGATPATPAFSLTLKHLANVIKDE